MPIESSRCRQAASTSSSPATPSTTCATRTRAGWWRGQQWLRPGGRLIVADMMFGRGGTSEDRAIIRSKVCALARKGIGGWWRIAKNSYRYLVRVA